ncbi:ATP-binding protein [Skermanella pratensis]|uniref:ATP-binding protein n=1 Tax=Skermanella pratensis TaxID=2233999 RepID=UPI0013014B66|nr:ATP-binding protein [Skermanella pratensis]
MTDHSTGPDSLLDALLHASPGAVVIVGRSAAPSAPRVIRANRAAESLPTAVMAALLDRCDEASVTGTAGAVDLPHEDAAGKRWLRLNATREGAVVVGTVSDITELRGTQQALDALMTAFDGAKREAERQREAAHAAGEAKSRFLATMSHELRTPMNAILGFADLLKLCTIDPQQVSYVEIIRRSGQDLLRVLNDILDFSKIEAGFLTLERRPLSPASIARDVVMLFAATARDKETSLFVTTDSDVPDWIEGDVTRLRQVLSNLIGNACKFTEDGRIDVRVSAGPTGMVEFAVIDTGIGMTPEQVRQLFQPFVQADVTTTRRFGGTGLGLAISKRLVEAMGGSVRVTSMPGEGSAFLIRIPAHVCAPPAYADDDGLEEAAAPDFRRVLLAEDNAINRMLVERILEQDGHEIVSVPDGRLAVLEIAETGVRTSDNPFGYDLVLMDMHMPEMDGPTATRTIRELAGPASSIPIIGLSADAMTDQMDSHMSAGLDAYLTKPLDHGKLRAMVARTRSSMSAAPAMPESAGEPAPRREGPESQHDRDLIDEAQIEEIRAGVGDEMLAELLSAFCDDVGKEFDRVRNASAAEDWAALAVSAHTLKGVASNLGAARIAGLAKSLELAAKDAANLNTVAPILELDSDLFGNLATAVDRTVRALSRRT